MKNNNCNFKKTLPFFAISAVVLTVFWIWLVGLYTKPTKEQMVSLFVGTKTANSSLIEEKVNIDNYKGLLKLDFKEIPTNNMLMMYYTSVGQSECDLFIISENDFIDKFGEYYNCFLPLNDVTDLSNNNYSFFENNGDLLGLKMKNDFFTDESEYYVFISKQSLHIKPFSTDSVDDYLFKIVKDLI